MEPVLLKYHGTYNSLPISFQVSAVDFNSDSGSLASTSAAALSVARNLKLPVLTSFNGVEAQHFSIVSSVLAQLKVANVHLFDGLAALKTNQTIGAVLPSAQIDEISKKLYAALSDKIGKLHSSAKISLALSELNKILNTNYQPFEQYGDKNAATTFVVYSTTEQTVNLFKHIPKVSSKVGVIVARVPLPFETAEFNKLVSKNTKKLVVVTEALGATNSLKLDVQASLFFEGVFIEVVDASYPSGIHYQR
ncbi:unnamed protein product [Ambrosiozyma monospora]|uniref:Unnamed protein product n=1 Tax=Ambrosiozyma monospora TaxID=43982 RepID=A0ACB5TGU2_AMBMO|nr:unnamed protein product [Ambrosiozyma monospora]